MRRIALLVALSVPFIAGAAAADEVIITGSWGDSCHDGTYYADGTLAASCQRMNGSWNYSQLNVSSCGYVENRDGELSCADDMAGSYLATCRDVRRSGEKIEAVCEDTRGGWHNAQISSRACGGTLEIANFNGRLACASR